MVDLMDIWWGNNLPKLKICPDLRIALFAPPSPLPPLPFKKRPLKTIHIYIYNIYNHMFIFVSMSLLMPPVAMLFQTRSSGVQYFQTNANSICFKLFIYDMMLSLCHLYTHLPTWLAPDSWQKWERQYIEIFHMCSGYDTIHYGSIIDYVYIYICNICESIYIYIDIYI